MALFKISKGSASSLNNQPKTEGYCWFTTDDGKFYIDVSNSVRQVLNAGTADTLKNLTATVAELNHMDGVTSNVQTQLDGKAASSHNHAATEITSGTLSSDRLPTVPIAKGGTGATTAAAALTNLGITATAAELNKMDGVTATTTELNYVDGVTSNIQTQLDKKANDFSLRIYNGTSGNPKPVKFATVNYSTCTSEAGVAIKLGLVSGHGNGSSYAFLEDAIIKVGYTGSVSVDNFKYYGEAVTDNGVARQYGDIFWVIDTTNKIVDFYCLMGQYARLQMTPYKRVTYSTGGTITQYTSCTVYSSGDKVWGNNSDIALKSDFSGIDFDGYATTDALNTHTSNADIHFTATERTKLSNIEAGAQVNTVTGVKGNSESSFRTGNINITKANIGLGNVDNTADSAKSVKSATSAGSATKATQDASGNVITTTYETKTDASAKLETAKSYTDTAISNLINGAPTTLDTLGEIAAAMEENEDVVAALNTAIGTKANTADLTSHTSNISNPHNTTLAQLGVTATATELNYVDGVTSNIQTQLNNKAPSSHTHTITASASDDDVVILTGTSGSNSVIYSAQHATSGVSAGTYGETQTVANGTFKIPSISVDNKGHITQASTVNITIPASENYLPLSGGTLSGDLVLQEELILTENKGYGSSIPTGVTDGTLYFVEDNTQVVLSGDASGSGTIDSEGIISISTSIPSASSSSKGLVTTESQTFGGTKTFSRIALTATTDAALSQYNAVALTVGPSSGTHLEIDGDEIMAKTSASASGTLYLNREGGNVYLGSSVYSTGDKLYGAVWNDYAEFRAQKENIEPGYCVASTDNGQVYKTTEMYQACDGIVSDTFGFSIGETEECKTPLAVAGRVLAYCAGNKEDYHAGDTVCAGPGGLVYKMSREEIREWPDRIVGIVSEIPEYERWGSGNILVNNRIWIKVI